MDKLFVKNNFYKIPKKPGIYAWYFKPRMTNWDLVKKQISKILTNDIVLESKINLRYGINLVGKSKFDTYVDKKGNNFDDVLEKISKKESSFILNFIKKRESILLNRPLYIGITNNLYRRINNDHVKDIESYHLKDNKVNRYIEENPKCELDEILSLFNYTHSFALEARIKNINILDLIVNVHEVEVEYTDSELEKLEDIMQYFVDPICGKK